MNYDVIISGAGLAGSILALALSKFGMHIALIDKNKKNFQDNVRTTTIAYGCALLLKKWGVWKDIAFSAGPIHHILTDDSGALLHYDYKLVGRNPMGYCISNEALGLSLFNRINDSQNIDYFPEISYEGICQNSDKISLKLNNGNSLTAALFVVAEGKNTKINTMLPFVFKSSLYNQSALVLRALSAEDHNLIAVEKFTQEGPLAVLPMKVKNQLSVIWNLDVKIANILKNVDDEQLVKFLNQRLGMGITKISSEKHFFPLKMRYALNYYSGRCLLMGDSLHSIHPIAGQGFNLILRDINVLSMILEDCFGLGLDIGSDDVLAKFEKKRKIANLSMIHMTDKLNSLFMSNNYILKKMRRLGLNFVDSNNKMKYFFIKKAML